jgi:hypothetical protein
MSSRARSVARACAALTIMTAGPGAIAATTSTAAGVQQPGTIQVSKTEIVEGETITVSNTDDDASRCEGGLVVVYVSSLPPGELSQRVQDVDDEGSWSFEFTAPFAADFPSMAIGPDYTFTGTCEAEVAQVDDAGGALTPAAAPPFAYDPVTVRVVAPAEPEVPAAPEAPTDPVVGGAADPATPVVAAPTLAG